MKKKSVSQIKITLFLLLFNKLSSTPFLLGKM